MFPHQKKKHQNGSRFGSPPVKNFPASHGWGFEDFLRRIGASCGPQASENGLKPSRKPGVAAVVRPQILGKKTHGILFVNFGTMELCVVSFLRAQSLGSGVTWLVINIWSYQSPSFQPPGAGSAWFRVAKPSPEESAKPSPNVEMIWAAPTKPIVSSNEVLRASGRLVWLLGPSSDFFAITLAALSSNCWTKNPSLSWVPCIRSRYLLASNATFFVAKNTASRTISTRQKLLSHIRAATALVAHHWWHLSSRKLDIYTFFDHEISSYFCVCYLFCLHLRVRNLEDKNGKKKRNSV